jgi:hypothetical protein
VPVLKNINQDKKWKDPLQTTLWPKRSSGKRSAKKARLIPSNILR